MLHRVGVLSFEQISNFMVRLMQNFNWKQAAFVYEKDGYDQVGGVQTCHL